MTNSPHCPMKARYESNGEDNQPVEALYTLLYGNKYSESDSNSEDTEIEPQTAIHQNYSDLECDSDSSNDIYQRTSTYIDRDKCVYSNLEESELPLPLIMS